MRRLLLILWLALHLGLAWPVTAQPPNFSFKHLTIDDGLSQNAVFAILQDHHGLMWFGTKDGLNRYDGYSFTVYQSNPFDSTSLLGSSVTALFEDSRGSLWVGTSDGGLNRFYPETQSFQHVKYASPHSGRSGMSAITAMAEDFNHNLWVGASGDGLLRVTIDDPQASGATVSTPFVHRPGESGSLSNNTVQALLVDAKGILWIGTDKGLDKFVSNKNGNSFQHFTIFTKNPKAPVTANDSSVTALFTDSKGNLWLGTISGICRFDRDSGTHTTYPHHYEIYRYGWGIVVSILEDDAGKLWLATPGELMRFDPEDQSYAYFRHDPQNAHSISYNGVSSLCRDRSNLLWFGTPGAGIDRYDPKAHRFATLVRSESTPSRIAGFSVRSILEDNTGQLWVSTEFIFLVAPRPR